MPLILPRSKHFSLIVCPWLFDAGQVEESLGKDANHGAVDEIEGEGVFSEIYDEEGQ